MARSRKRTDRPASRKRHIERYGHRGAPRRNDSPVGLVSKTVDRGDLTNRFILAPV
jgi:hypothetical protein